MSIFDIFHLGKTYEHEYDADKLGTSIHANLGLEPYPPISSLPSSVKNSDLDMVQKK